MSTAIVYCKKWLITLHVLLLLMPMSVFADSADEVYSQYADSVFQIRIMEVKSSSRAAIGSGFIVGNGQFLATNYHVIAGKVLEPEKYRIEVDINDETVEFDVLKVDVVHDVALISPIGFTLTQKPFELAKGTPRKGSKVYSLGNPRDIGMTVVEGNYNGFVEDRFFDQIHLSGAINPGMSGGPALNDGAQVIGVNVATGGNQIGFLVPLSKLEKLLTDIDQHSMPDHDTLLASMSQQITTATTAMIDDLLEEPWPDDSIGSARVVGKIGSWMECWGNSNNNKDIQTLEISKGCNNSLNFYISPSVNTGFIEYEFFYLEAPEWPATSIYRFMSRSTANAIPGNRINKDHAQNFTCTDEQIQLDSGLKQRISYCTRPYKKFKGLYDTFFMGVSTDKNKQVIMNHFTLAGVTKVASLRFLERFMSKLAWQ